MLQPDATLQQIRIHLNRELRRIYPEGETRSLIRLILQHFGFELSTVIKDPDRKPGSAAVAQINKIVNEISTQKPIQYILGYTHFFDLKIRLNHNVLIPRPETEEMIFRIIEQTPTPPGPVLDIGTGSGCIALALKKHFHDADVYGMEVKKEALDVARENSIHTGLAIHWIRGDILGEVPDEIRKDFRLIVSNPPYVLQEQRQEMEANVLRFEPEVAIFAPTEDPLVFYRKIAEFASYHLDRKGSVWMEVNEQLGNETAMVFRKAGFADVALLQDIHGKDRYIRINR
jgi:release factor glutamine methyltransferase